MAKIRRTLKSQRRRPDYSGRENQAANTDRGWGGSDAPKNQAPQSRMIPVDYTCHAKDTKNTQRNGKYATFNGEKDPSKLFCGRRWSGLHARKDH